VYIPGPGSVAGADVGGEAAFVGFLTVLFVGRACSFIEAQDQAAGGRVFPDVAGVIGVIAGCDAAGTVGCGRLGPGILAGILTAVSRLDC
jgi:hypothetical protein